MFFPWNHAGHRPSQRSRVKARPLRGVELLENRSLLAVVATLVEDAIPGDGINRAPAGSSPQYVIEVNGTIYFTANDGTNGRELWRINPEGVAEIVDDAIPGGGILPGSGSSIPDHLTNINGTLYFVAKDVTNGNELWRISPAGVAEIVEDAIPGGGIRSGLNGSSPTQLTNVNGTLYFAADDGTNGLELWRIIPAGIVEIVEDAIAGGGIRSGSYSSNPTQLTNVNGTLYFKANDGINGIELWRINSGGVAEMVEDAIPGGGIRPVSGVSPFNYFGLLANVNGTLYFEADDGTNGRQSWRIDSAGVAEMVDIAIFEGGVQPTSFYSYSGTFTNVNGTIYFVALDGANGPELWRLNPAGFAELIEDAIPGGGIRPGLAGSQPRGLTNVDGTLYFGANDGTNGIELWRVSSAGVAEIVEDAIASGGIAPGSSDSRFSDLTVVNSTLYFRARDGVNGYELWRVNPAGVAEMVEDAIPGGGIAPGSGDSIRSGRYSQLTNVDGTLYFLANDGANGDELWRINPAGMAEIVEDAIRGGGIRPGSSGSAVNYFNNLTNVVGTLYFQANDGTNGIELWRVNPAGVAEMVEDAIPGGGIRQGTIGSIPFNTSGLPNRIAANGTLYFPTNDGTNGYELWWINPAGVAEMVEDAIPGGGIQAASIGSYPGYLTNVDGTLYFAADDGTSGTELWRINPAGVAVMVEDAIPGGGIRPGTFGSGPRYLTNFNGTLYFVANDGTNGNELWRINPAGVAVIVEDAISGGGIRPGSSGSFPENLSNINGTLYFTANDGANGTELWRINVAGVAELVEDAILGGGFAPGAIGSSISNLSIVSGTLYFTANDGTNGFELWRINPVGVAQMVEDAIPGGGIAPGAIGSSISNLTIVGGTLYFRANDGTNGEELWRINTAGVAEMVEDAIPGGGIASGANSSSISNLTIVGGTLYFGANDGTNGLELWRINPAGVAEMVEDATPGGGIRPDLNSSRPSNLTNVGGSLYFAANDGSNGYELWRINLAGAAEIVEDAIPGGGIAPGSSGSSPSNLTYAGGTLYFVANDGTNGVELWRIDASGRADLIEDAIPGGGIWPGTGDAFGPSPSARIAEFDGTVFFVANDGTNGIELWRIDEVGDSEPFFPRSLEVKPSGVEIAFQWGDVDAGRLRLYSGQGQGDLIPNVTLVGRTTGPVACSAVWDSATRRLRLVRTGGPLPPDVYTLRLKSGADGIVSTTGKRLDGNRDGLADDDYVATFTVAPSTGRTISLPDFSRGPGQAVMLADPQSAATDGIPLSIDNAQGVQSVRFDLEYDPRLLSIDRASSHVGSGMTGWTLSLVEETPGKLVGRLAGPTLPAGARTLLVLKAQVPTSAPRGAAQALRLSSLQLNANSAALGNDAVHAVAALGDASGDGVYSGLDASLLARLSVGLETGFSAMPTIDPTILGDVTGNGTISALDAAFVARKAIGLNQPEIPDLPAGPPAAALPAPAPFVPLDALVTESAAPSWNEEGSSRRKLAVPRDDGRVRRWELATQAFDPPNPVEMSQRKSTSTEPVEVESDDVAAAFDRYFERLGGSKWGLGG